MNEKSFTTIETKLCVTCGCEYSTGALLVDRKMESRFDQETCTGWGLCDQHLKAANEGYVAVIEIDDSKSTHEPDGSLTNEGAYRTGNVVLVQRAALNSALSKPVASNSPAVYIDQEAFAKMFPGETIKNAPFERDRSTKDSFFAPGTNTIN